MRIGDLAARTGVSASRIRFYEARGLLPTAARRENGYRDYPASMAPTLRYIEAAQTLGFSLREIGAASPAMGSATALDTILPALEGKLSDVEAHIAAAQTLRSRLIQLIAEQRQCRPPPGRSEGVSSEPPRSK